MGTAKDCRFDSCSLVYDDVLDFIALDAGTCRGEERPLPHFPAVLCSCFGEMCRILKAARTDKRVQI